MGTVRLARSHHEALAFVGVTVGMSWLVWIPLGLEVDLGEPSTVRLLGAFAPSVVAVLLSAAAGRTVLLDLLGRIRRVRVGLRWYGFALGFPAAVSLGATAIAVALGWPAPAFGQPPAVSLLPLPADVDPWLALPVVFIQSLLLGSAMGEELGWRGYLLPRLQARTSALGAGLAVGFVWGGWHLPLWLAPGSEVALVPAIAGILADAVLFTWLFNNTRGSLVPALVFHASIAVTGLYLAAAGPALLPPALKWLIVVVILHRYGASQLAR